MNAQAKFQVGREYSCRSIGDSGCVFRFTVVGRTEKSVTLKGEGKTVRRSVKVFSGQEVCFPLGKYSMCPTIYA